MKLKIILPIVIIAVFLGIIFFPRSSLECSKLPYAERDACCAKSMEGKVQVTCVGAWFYNQYDDLCKFECETSSTQEQAETNQPETPVQEVIAETEEITEEIQGEPAETELSDADKARIEFLKKTENIKSYSYLDFYSKNNYYIKGNKIKIKLFSPVLNPFRYEYVYLNTDTKTAYAYCASLNGCTYQERLQYRKINYEDYIIKTPLDLVKELNKGALGKETQQIEGATLNSITYMDANNNQVTFWLHSNYAFPYEITTESPSGSKAVVRYSDVAFNYLRDSDVVPPADAVLVE